ncbi:hypothetical protein [Caballeronia ptereochthonis]|uniref:Uncharacterized protein n=1 Tax=Caballeronia ptereochthonis TaxID=1777144 RepID=A0A158DZ58_9BURK|nr:hypothetical protein [Caballeronia ptereochthonis]SAK99813.1 hypothetical protein AWB83_06150 [Caballeronia ptereochthonis]
MADFVFLFLFLAALAGSAVTSVLNKHLSRAQRLRGSDAMCRGLEHAYMEGVIDGQSQSVDLDAFRARMAAWLATSTLRDEWGNEAAPPMPPQVAREPANAEAEPTSGRNGSCASSPAAPGRRQS